MFVRRSKYRDLKARHELAVEQLAEATKDAEGPAKPQPVVHLDDERLQQALKECDRLRAENRQLERRVSNLQKRVDDALGIGDVGLTASELWKPPHELRGGA